VETEYLLMVGRDLGYVKAEQTGPLLEEIHEIAAMLHGLRCKVEEAC
jgi:four helix bundle protein